MIWFFLTLPATRGCCGWAQVAGRQNGSSGSSPDGAMVICKKYKSIWFYRGVNFSTTAKEKIFMKSCEHAGLIFVFWYYGIIIRSQNSIYLLIITQPHNQDDCGWYPSNMNVVRELQLFTDFILFYISFGTGIVSILIRICIFSSLQNKMDSLIQFHLGLGDRFCIGDLRTENYENFKLKLQKNLNLYFKEDINPYLKFKILAMQKLNLPWSWRVRRNPSRRARWVGEGGAGGAVRRNRLKLSLSKWISKCKRNGIRR